MKPPTPLPRPPTGNSPVVQLLRQMLKCLQERTILYVDGADVSYQTDGTAIRTKPKRGGGAAPEQATGMIWKGEWLPTSSYDEGDVVVVRGGISSGLYIADTDRAAGASAPDPSSGDGWISLAPGHTRGQWT